MTCIVSLTDSVGVSCTLLCVWHAGRLWGASGEYSGLCRSCPACLLAREMGIQARIWSLQHQLYCEPTSPIVLTFLPVLEMKEAAHFFLGISFRSLLQDEQVPTFPSPQPHLFLLLTLLFPVKPCWSLISNCQLYDIVSDIPFCLCQVWSFLVCCCFFCIMLRGLDDFWD